MATYVLEGDEKVEDIPAGVCYVIAGNGMFMKTTQAMYRAVRKIDSIPGLATIQEYTHAVYPRIPLKLVLAVSDFFKKVYDKFKSESVVVLYYSKEKNKWYVDVPKQKVSGASAKYASDILKMDGFARVGSIHSHADFQAFHSGVDDHDEKTFDGIHMTIGHVNSNERSYSVRLMCGEKSEKLDFVNSLSANDYDYETCPDAWLDNVEELKFETTYYNNGQGDFDMASWYGGQHGSAESTVVNRTSPGRVTRRSGKLTEAERAALEAGEPVGCCS